MIAQNEMAMLIAEAAVNNTQLQKMMGQPAVRAWLRNLGEFEAADVRRAIHAHEDAPPPAAGFPRPAPDPVRLRRWILDDREREAAKRLALTAPPRREPRPSLRQRDPEAWARHYAEGVARSLESLERQGRLSVEAARRLAEYRRTGRLPQPF